MCGVLVLFALTAHVNAKDRAAVSIAAFEPARAAGAVRAVPAGSVEAAQPPTNQEPAVPDRTPSSLIARWFDLQTATVSSRYRFIDNSDGITTNNHLQHGEGVKARVKFDAAGRYSVNIGLASGNGFTCGWNDAGIGTPGDLTVYPYVKQLFFAAVPVRGIELQYGGLSIARGENTEITSYDNDNYIVGERVSAKRADVLYFDELSATLAYLGDVTTSDFFKRYRRLDDTNYYQFLAAKKLGRRVAASIDYTSVSGLATVRGAFTAKVAESRLLDLVRVEAYRRVEDAATGFSFYGEKSLAKWMSAGGGWADIDRYYGELNADRFNKGRRLFTNATVALGPELSLQLFYGHIVANDYAVSNRSRLDIVLGYNLLKALQKKGS